MARLRYAVYVYCVCGVLGDSELEEGGKKEGGDEVDG